MTRTTTTTTASPPLEQKPVAAEPPKRLRILVADDDDDVRCSLVLLLEAYGHEVIAVPSGASLLTLLTPWLLEEDADPPADVLVTDVRMPGVNGIEIVEGLRANGWVRPIVVISAFADAEMQEQLTRVGGVTLLPKPFEADLLEAALTTVSPAYAEQTRGRTTTSFQALT